MANEHTDAEARARDLRVELEQLAAAEGALQGLVLVDPGEQYRLDQVRAAVRERVGELAELQAEARR